MLESGVPDALREAVQRDLRPVQPLPAPWKRALGLIPFVVLLLVGVPLWYGLRHDAPSVGTVALWGGSAVLVAGGLLSIALALRESVPARALSWLAVVLATLAAVAVLVSVTFITNAVSPTVARPSEVRLFWWFCWTRSLVLGAPLVFVCGVLAARALPSRPEVAGALYGVGCGLLVEGGWRLFCDVSDPVHVFLAHGASVLVLAALGALGAGLWERFLRRRGSR